jgi:endonuclease-3 related protein
MAIIHVRGRIEDGENPITPEPPAGRPQRDGDRAMATGSGKVNGWDPMPVYRKLLARNGHRNWWPGRTRIEIIAGAILTQNTAWTNAETALANLEEKGWLRVESLREVPERRLAEAIRPSGYFRQKARKLKAFVAFLDAHYGGSLRRMSFGGVETLRPELLGIWGIGPETADSILLYAFGKPVFVIDAYTRRVLVRHGWAGVDAAYEDLRKLMERSLPEDAGLWNDYHAQLVRVGQSHCGTRPRCEGCPLEPMLPPGGPMALRR